ncbi:MAG: AAA family ATPase [Oscillospiraceae bacterium]|nr:AAA family ATPase [Oscillospiraceae bacterium]
MYIKKLAASFGRLERAELSLRPGLNVIESPNEGGKSTWTAFLQIMFYGLNTRDRSPNADKRRYQPWSGAFMEGSMDLQAGGRDLTLTRRTARANSPMSAFSAVYTGTASPVEGLTASDCGELLLGVPQEVYVRSALIRQGGLAIGPHAALEQRINALITTGEEDVSCSAVSDRLRRQLNRRRHNQTGLLPQLERELTLVQTTLGELQTLDAQLQGCEKDLTAIQSQIQNVHALLSRHEAADQADALSRQAEARQEAQAASRRLAQLVEEARRRADRSAQALQEAEGAAAAHSPPESAAETPPRLLLWPLLAIPLAFAAAFFFSFSPAAAAGALAISFLIIMGILLLHARQKSRWQAGQDRRQAEETAYQALLSALDAARAAHQSDLDALSAAEAGYEASLRSAQPAAALSGASAQPVKRPTLTRDQLQNSLRALLGREESLKAAIHRTAGQIQGRGDPIALREQEAALLSRREGLQAEYDAIALAMEVLSQADTDLQNRFSPALGEKSAEIFTKLTQGKYNRVLLDREMTPSAQETDRLAPHEAALLSQGASDQLYLAVRLAVCQLVLPAENAAPIILDDALVSFDDGRMAAALDYLLELSAQRQILLFTCQSREASCLRRLHPNACHIVSL